MSLDSVGNLVAQHSSSIAPSQSKLDKAHREQAIVQYMFKWLSIGMIIVGIAVLMLVANKYFDLGKWFGLVTAVLMIGGVGVASCGVLNAIRKGASLPVTEGPKELPLADKSLPTNPSPESLASVTERTTQLIGSRGSRQEQESDR
jgi:hypothetical protein